MRFKDEMHNFLSSVQGKFLVFLLGLCIVTLLWLFSWI